VDLHGVELKPAMSAPIARVVEKPAKAEAPSNLSIVGRYVLSQEIWPLLASTQAGAGGEIQLTDAIGELMTSRVVEAFAMTGRSFDCGNKLGYAQTFVESALLHPEIGDAFRQWLATKAA